jgi:hypothetical protein
VPRAQYNPRSFHHLPAEWSLSAVDFESRLANRTVNLLKDLAGALGSDSSGHSGWPVRSKVA